jgi:hypothetical protein
MWLFRDQDVLIVAFVVVVFKTHSAPLEWILLYFFFCGQVFYFFGIFISNFFLDDHTFFQHLRCLDRGVLEEYSFVTDQGYTLQLLNGVKCRTEIWVICALLGWMTVLAAAHTPLYSFFFLFYLLILVVLFVDLNTMFLEFATKRILGGLAAAPPNLTAVLWGMGATGPVEIFFVVKGFGTILTNFLFGLRTSETLFVPQKGYPSLQIFNLSN